VDIERIRRPIITKNERNLSHPEGEGSIELDGEIFPVKPMTAIFIKPGCRHRAIGALKILNSPVPAFDIEDEWFD
jgi:hypothetical protein